MYADRRRSESQTRFHRCSSASVGGLVPFFDHGLPHDVSYASFLHFVKRLKQACGG
jgi:hypothetical protein